MQRSTINQSHGLATGNVQDGESQHLFIIVELAAIICTGSKHAFLAASAAESRIVQRKGSPVRWKGLRVQWKGSRRAAEMWSSQQHNRSYIT